MTHPTPTHPPSPSVPDPKTWSDAARAWARVPLAVAELLASLVRPR